MMAVSLVLKRAVSPSLLVRQGRWQARFNPLYTSRQLQHKSRPAKVKSHNAKSAILRSMPADAWDCHMHVTSPDYPLAANAAYKPALHDIKHAMAFEKTVGVRNVVLVQPSIYGNDNNCLLDALKAIGPRHGRGVIGIDPDAPIDFAMLEGCDELGVRGVRLNLKSTNVEFTEESLRVMLEKYARVIKDIGWVLELFIGMENMPLLEKVSGNLGVQLCIAHFGAPRLPPVNERAQPFDPYDVHGFRALVNMLKRGDVWVKFSAAYRFDDDPEMHGIEAMARELLARAGDRVIFATDWPHTRFDGLDVRPFVERCLQWTDEVGLTEKVFTLNAKELWDVRD